MINFSKANLETVAVHSPQYPPPTTPEIALAGRSNVGKSSLINCLVNRKNLARTSSSPGKTATINFYNIDDSVRLVDLPGYGYAKVSKVEKEKWAKMIDAYLKKRENLIQVILLVDSRHPPTKDDLIMLNWITSLGHTPIVISTKLDKLKKSQIEKHLTTIYEQMRLNDDSILLPFSAEKRTGKEELMEVIDMVVERSQQT